MFILMIEEAGDSPSAEHALEGNLVTVGRKPGNTIIIPDKFVSSKHAEIHLRGDTCELVDLGSHNGTFVNEKKIDRAILKSGDQLRFGTRKARFAAKSSEGVLAAPPAKQENAPVPSPPKTLAGAVIDTPVAPTVPIPRTRTGSDATSIPAAPGTVVPFAKPSAPVLEPAAPSTGEPPRPAVTSPALAAPALAAPALAAPALTAPALTKAAPLMAKASTVAPAAPTAPKVDAKTDIAQPAPAAVTKAPGVKMETVPPDAEKAVPEKKAVDSAATPALPKPAAPSIPAPAPAAATTAPDAPTTTPAAPLLARKNPPTTKIEVKAPAKSAAPSMPSPAPAAPKTTPAAATTVPAAATTTPAAPLLARKNPPTTKIEVKAPSNSAAPSMPAPKYSPPAAALAAPESQRSPVAPAKTSPPSVPNSPSPAATGPGAPAKPANSGPPLVAKPKPATTRVAVKPMAKASPGDVTRESGDAVIGSEPTVAVSVKPTRPQPSPVIDESAATTAVTVKSPSASSPVSGIKTAATPAAPKPASVAAPAAPAKPATVAETGAEPTVAVARPTLPPPAPKLVDESAPTTKVNVKPSASGPLQASPAASTSANPNRAAIAPAATARPEPAPAPVKSPAPAATASDAAAAAAAAAAIAAATAEAGALKARLISADEEKKTLREENRSLSEKTADLQSRFFQIQADLEESRRNYESRIASLEAENEEVRRYVEALEREKAHAERSSSQQKAVLESRIASEEEELQYLKSQVATLKDQIAANRSAKTENERAHSARIREFETLLSAKERETDKLSRQVSRQELQIQGLEARGEDRSAEHRETIAALESELDGLKISSRESAHQLASAERDLARLRDENRAALDEVLADNDRLKQALRVAEARIATQPAAAPGSDQSLATQLRSEIITLETKSANLERIKNELARNHQAQVFKFSGEIERLKAERESIQKTLDTERRKLDEIGGKSENALTLAKEEVNLLRGNLMEALQSSAQIQEAADERAREHEAIVTKLQEKIEQFEEEYRNAQDALLSERARLEDAEREKVNAVTKVQAEAEKLRLELRDAASNADAAHDALEERARYHESRSTALREDRDRFAAQCRDLQDKLTAARKGVPSGGDASGPGLEEARATITHLEQELAAAHEEAAKNHEAASSTASIMGGLDQLKARYRQAQDDLEAERRKLASASLSEPALAEARAEIAALKQRLAEADARVIALSKDPRKPAVPEPPVTASATPVAKPAPAVRPPLSGQSFRDHELKNLGIVLGKKAVRNTLRLDADELSAADESVVLTPEQDDPGASQARQANLEKAEAALEALKKELGKQD